MSYNWHKVKDLDPKTRAIIANKEKARISGGTEVAKLRHQVSIFLKFGNSDANTYNAVDTIEIYKDFTIDNDSVWISTDSLSNGMAQKKIDEFNNAIQNDKIVELYLIPSKTSGGNNDITHKARILEIIGNKNRMVSPDSALTPKIWVNIPKKIWIKVERIRRCRSKNTTDFIVCSTGNNLSESLMNSQYNFGYIEEI